MIRTYTDLSRLNTFNDRFEYLKLSGGVGIDTFGVDRIFNQRFYTSSEWKRIRRDVILRDNGCDLGIDGLIINGKIIIHHINPISLEDIENLSDYLVNPEYLICTSHQTHNAIHYGNIDMLPKEAVTRTKYDTCPWKIE